MNWLARKLARINDALIQTERQFIDPQGLAWTRVVQASDLRAGFLYGIRCATTD